MPSRLADHKDVQVDIKFLLKLVAPSVVCLVFPALSLARMFDSSQIIKWFSQADLICVESVIYLIS